MKLIKSFIFVAMFATCALAAHADDRICIYDCYFIICLVVLVVPSV